ncbi:hypothetical protein CR513_36261, partial [Mucuna pruriens]
MPRPGYFLRSMHHRQLYIHRCYAKLRSLNECYTRMEIQLSNKSVIQPLGVLEDVLLQVNDLIFLADFYVLNIEDKAPGKGSALILRRPFLMVARTKIDMYVEDPLNGEEAEIDSVNLEQAETISNNQLEARSDSSEKESQQAKAEFDFRQPSPLSDRVGQPTPSTEDKFVSPQSPITELKPLPKHLKYTYLEDRGCPTDKVAVVETESDPIGRGEKESHETTCSQDHLSHLRQLMDEFGSSGFGMTIMKNRQGEMMLTRIRNSWQVYIDSRKLNQATRKDHFLLPFIDQVLEKLAGKSHYCFLDGFVGYMQIHIALVDQYKTTFTCPFGTFAYTRMSFGLCNAVSTFLRYMISIFFDLLEDCMEVFMDDFTVYAESFEACLDNLSPSATQMYQK